jgi:Mu-like prophage I protein
MSGLTYIPSPREAEFVELGRSQRGRLFKKQLLRYGEYAHPNVSGEKLVVDETMVDSIIANFSAKVCDIVQVPVANDSNAHVEDPFRNIGEVVDLTKEKDGLYGFIDVRKAEAAEDLGKTLIGASAMIHMNYTDTRSGKKVGPTLLHAAITNRPYIVDMADFEEIVAASADNYGERPVVLTDKEENGMATKEELIQQLRDEYEVDVEALEAEAIAAKSQDELVSALTGVLRESGAVSLSQTDDSEVTIKDVAEAVIELSQEKAASDERIATLVEMNEQAQQAATANEVDDLVKAGRVLPAQRDAMVQLANSDRDMFDQLVPAAPIVSMDESGVTTHQETPVEKLDEEITRLTAVADEMTGGKK